MNIKRIFLLCLLTLVIALSGYPTVVQAQSYPSPTYNVLTLQTPLGVSSGGSGVVTSTGTGNLVLSNSPGLVTPALGTPTSVVLTNATGLPVSTGLTGLGPGVLTALQLTTVGSGGGIVTQISPSLTTPNLGTPSAITLTNGTGLPISTGVSGLGTGVATALAATLTGTGALVQTGSPTITTPVITGVTNASNAITGSVGEYIQNTASSQPLTSGGMLNVTSISLTAGDWDVFGGFLLTGSVANLTNNLCGWSTTSATFGSVGTYAQLQGTAITTYGGAIPIGHVNVSTTTTVYLVCLGSFATGTATASGLLGARRVR